MYQRALLVKNVFWKDGEPSDGLMTFDFDGPHSTIRIQHCDDADQCLLIEVTDWEEMDALISKEMLQGYDDSSEPEAEDHD